MNTLMLLIPSADPLPLPAPPWLLHVLLLLTFFLHVLAMNFVLGGTIIAAVERFRTDESTHEFRKWFAKLAPTMIAAAVTLGVAPLLFLQTLYGRVFFPSSVHIGWFWFSVVPVLIVAYYAAYAISFGQHATLRNALIAILPLFFMAIAFIYSNNMTLMLRPAAVRTGHAADARGVTLNLSDPTLWPRYLHMLFGGIAVAGLMIALYGVWRSRSDEDAWKPAIVRGSKWFFGATIASLVFGFWWLGALPSGVRLLFMGQNIAATIALAAGIVAGIASLALVALVPISRAPQKLVKWGSVLAVATLILMIFARDQIRAEMLRAAGFTMTEWVEPQWAVIAIFVLLLVGGIGTTIWMASLLFRPAKAEEQPTGAPLGVTPTASQ